MELTIVIPCHDGAEDTRECLEALSAQSGAPPLRVVLVDNGCTDHTAAVAAGFPFVERLDLGTNRGFAGGVNAGLAVADTPWIMILNNDTKAGPHLIERLLRAARSDERIGLVAPVSNHVKGVARLDVGSTGATPEGRVAMEELLDTTCGGRLHDQANLSGLCLLFPRLVYEQTGGFDERFGIGNYEDDDFCLRARLRGHRLVIARDAFLHHEGHRTFQRIGVDYHEVLARHRQAFEDKWQDDPAALAWIARDRGDLASAAALPNAARAAYPAWPDPGRYLGEAAAAQGDAEGAIGLLSTYLGHCPGHTEVIALLAHQQHRCGRADAARETLQWAQRHCFFEDRTLVGLFERLARSSLQQDHPLEALDHLEAALSFEPNSAPLHNLQGAALLALDRLQEARVWFTRASEQDHPEATANLGVVLWQLGERGEAVKVWQDQVTADPDNHLAGQHLARLSAAGVSP